MGSSTAPRRSPLRVLTAVPLCDGHDSAITTINLELARAGIEVIYLGYHQPASAIARAAIQEDVHAVGISSYNGGHRLFFREVLAHLRRRGGADIPVFGGGGGTITAADARHMQRDGVDRIFPVGTPLDEIVRCIQHDYARPLRRETNLRGDHALARAITLLENSARSSRERQTRSARRTRTSGRGFTIGIAGPGGVGKSTLIDELVARFLATQPTGRVAVLANDPSYPESHGAILGDRVAALHARDDRVFFRSLATRGDLRGISAAVPGALRSLRASDQFDLIFVESLGLGQDGDPFGVFDGAGPIADTTLFVLSPHYGGRIQLQKIALLNGADMIVLNKADDPRTPTATAEISAQLAANRRNQPLHPTTAARHNDPGVTQLYAALTVFAGLEPKGGERACQLQIDD